MSQTLISRYGSPMITCPAYDEDFKHVYVQTNRYDENEIRHKCFLCGARSDRFIYKFISLDSAGKYTGTLLITDWLCIEHFDQKWEIVDKNDLRLEGRTILHSAPGKHGTVAYKEIVEKQQTITLS